MSAPETVENTHASPSMFQSTEGDAFHVRCCALASARRAVIQPLHECLMRDYEQVLAALSRLEPRSDPHEKERRRPRYHVPAIRVPLKIAVDRHVRRRLKEISDAYAQLAAGAEESDLAWFDGARSRGSAFRESIPPHRLPRFLAAVGFLVAFIPKGVTTISHIHSPFLEMHGFRIFSVAWLVSYVPIIYVLGVRPSFHAKRALLLGDWPSTVIDTPPAVNVYVDELRLFSALHRRKRPEPRFVGLCDVVIVVIVAAFVLALPALGSFHYSNGYLIGLGVADLAFLPFVLIVITREEEWSLKNWR